MSVKHPAAYLIPAMWVSLSLAAPVVLASDNDYQTQSQAVITRSSAQDGQKQTSQQELNEQFWEAVRKGDVSTVAALLDKGADVNAKFRYGATALFKAAERGNVEIVKILLARGADVTVKDTFYGATAMTWALDNGHVEVIRELLEKQPDSVDDVLMNGVSGGKSEVVEIALAKGGAKKETLTTALVIASRNSEKPELAQALKAAGATMPPVVDAARLQSYVGKYKGEGPLEITITLNDGNLTAVATGQRPTQLIPTDDTTFRPLFAGAIVVQFKVENEKVTGLVLTQGSNKTDLAKIAETQP